MTDAVAVELIRLAGAMVLSSPAVYAASLGRINKRSIGEVKAEVKEVKAQNLAISVNIDGKMAQLLAVSNAKSYAEGVKDEHDKIK